MSWLERWFGKEVGGSSPPTGDPQAIAEVEGVLRELRPLLAADGGDVELLAVEEGWVHLRFRGACTSCAASTETLRGAIEPRMRERLGWVRGVRAL